MFIVFQSAYIERLLTFFFSHTRNPCIFLRARITDRISMKAVQENYGINKSRLKICRKTWYYSIFLIEKGYNKSNALDSI